MSRGHEPFPKYLRFMCQSFYMKKWFVVMVVLKGSSWMEGKKTWTLRKTFFSIIESKGPQFLHFILKHTDLSNVDIALSLILLRNTVTNQPIGRNTYR